MLQASPRSLATTCGISVDFFSSGYLDVSVRRVRSTLPIYSAEGTPKGGFPHSDIFGSKLICQLPEAFRRLSRPSSPVVAKASTMCTYSLDPITSSIAIQPAITTPSITETFSLSVAARTHRAAQMQSNPFCAHIQFAFINRINQRR